MVPPDHSFDDINIMPFYHPAICADGRVVKGIIFMSSVILESGASKRRHFIVTVTESES